jgi:hypothetical protein
VAEIAGRKFEVIDIRVPKMFKGIFPISMRNPTSYNLLQKLSRNQVPASCRIESSYISTFDNKTYGYQLNNCWHLLFKDCAQKIPVAVLAKRLQQEEMEVKVLSGLTEVIMTPQGSNSLRVMLNINGRQEEAKIQPGEWKSYTANQKVVMEVRRFEDNVYLVKFEQESLWVLFDGKRIEISAPQLLKFRSCGLCGDLNGENTADIKTPQKCLMSRPRYAAYSYMIKENSCQGVPSQDKSRYEHEIQECTKETIIPTPINSLAKRVASNSNKVQTKPLISAHLVEKQIKSGKLCISIQKVKMCSKMSKDEINQPKPIKVTRKTVQYVCVDAPSQLAQQLEQRAKAGESVSMDIQGKSVAFSKTEYEPVVCQRDL